VAGISFGGINTGLPPNIVDQLVEAEKVPIKTVQLAKGKTEAKLKLVNELTTKVTDIKKTIGDLASVRGFVDMKLTSGDPTVLNGTVDPTIAKSGNWNIEVVKLPESAGALTNGFPDKDKTQIGVGYFRFKTPSGEKRDVYIKKGNNTLEGAAKMINTSGVGVRASVLNDRKDPANPFKLMLSTTGTGNDKNIEYPTLYFLDGDQDIYFNSERKAQNGIVKVDGFDMEIGDTTLKDVIPGVALDIKQAAPGKPINIGIKEDREAISGKVKGFVDGINAVFTFIQSQNKLDEHTDTSQTLGGDGLLRTIESQLHNLVQNPQFGVKGSIKSLSQIGITFSRAGLLELDQKKFDTIMASDPTSIQEFMAGDGFNVGFIPALKRTLGNLTNPSYGPLANRKQGLTTKISQADRTIEDKERQLSRKEQQLREKFSRLEETMSKLHAQGNAVSALGGGGGGVQSLIQG
jgi:flagellar hook-associated protein 2